MNLFFTCTIFGALIVYLQFKYELYSICNQVTKINVYKKKVTKINFNLIKIFYWEKCFL